MRNAWIVWIVVGTAPPWAVHLPGRICRGRGLKGQSRYLLPLCLPRLRFSYTFFTTKLDERRRNANERERKGANDEERWLLDRLHCFVHPLSIPHVGVVACVFHRWNSINATLIIFNVLYRTSNFLGFFRVENWIFSHDGVPKEPSIIRFPSPWLRSYVALFFSFFFCLLADVACQDGRDR